ncbi:MAG: ABC transporter ATP-binding protein [Deltaproteobacteria bacterium]|nr:ABC transporter ATP-binding protein [Deltaproteobacteria bacterium]
MPAANPIIKITNLYFRYKKAAQPVFAGLNLTVQPGERLTILGPSEAGKSTLALCLQGLIPRLIKGEFQGRVAVAGADIQTCRPRELAGRVGLLFQDFEAQLFCTRVDQEVAFGPENLGLDREELKRRVGHSLTLVGLTGLEARDPATLSGGQRQLLALAAVLALEPQLLVLDEPTSDLDPIRVEELLQSLDRLAPGKGLTLVLLGQDLRLARNCSRLVLLNQGEVLADGPPEQVLRQVELFHQLGLQVPELPGLFHDLGQAKLPLTLEEAVAQARGLGWGEVREKFTPTLTLPPQGGGEYGPEILALRQVTYAYPGSAEVFKDFSLSFRDGEFTAILGPNGSGKTTLLKLLRGLLQPQSGEVWRAGGCHSGFVFQNPDYQICAEEVWEEVALGPRHLELAPQEVERRVAEALTQVHLLDRAHDDPFSLTKGQRQCLAVAGVLALAPKVIILDEPTTGLDYREQQGLLDLVADLHSQGRTIIMVTHSMWAAATYARRLVVLQDGQVMLDGPTREVLAQEDILAAARLRPPAVVRLSRRLGFLALTPQEFREQVQEKVASPANAP